MIVGDYVFGEVGFGFVLIGDGFLMLIDTRTQLPARLAYVDRWARSTFKLVYSILLIQWSGVLEVRKYFPGGGQGVKSWIEIVGAEKTGYFRRYFPQKGEANPNALLIGPGERSCAVELARDFSSMNHAVDIKFKAVSLSDLLDDVDLIFEIGWPHGNGKQPMYHGGISGAFLRCWVEETIMDGSYSSCRFPEDAVGMPVVCNGYGNVQKVDLSFTYFQCEFYGGK